MADSSRMTRRRRVLRGGTGCFAAGVAERCQRAAESTAAIRSLDEEQAASFFKMVLHADSTFVVTVQVLRIVVVILILPPFFRLLNRRDLRKHAESHVSL